MSFIKPGKLRPVLKKSRPESKPRNVWEDFNSSKTNSKKKEYKKSLGNRMLPASKQEDERVESAPEVDTSNYKARVDYEFIEEKLGVKFKDISLLARALTHRSALGIKERADYERLEFLGDAVLDLTMAHLLSDVHPDAKEGELSKMRAALVNTQALAVFAKKLELGPFIKLGRGELSSGGAERPSILADVMEAVIGAVYRDSSYEAVFKMIENVYGENINKVTPFDPKTELQEVLHAAGSEPPSYLLEMVEGPEHAPTFVTVVMVDGEVAGRGRGSTKKAAQQAAAAETLNKMAPDAPMPELVENQSLFLPKFLLVGDTVYNSQMDVIE